MTRVVLVPGVLALLPEYGSIQDPVRPLRAACLEAVLWLGPPARVVADEQGRRVADALLAVAARLDRVGQRSAEDAVLVVGNGSARRTDSSPGPYDERAVPFDDALGTALRGPDPAALRSTDRRLADDLWAATGSFAELADVLEAAHLVGVDYDDAPYGVQYWVMRWKA